MRNLILILLLCVTSLSFSQQQKGLNPSEFQQFKKDYAEMTRSKSYLAMRANSKEIAKKVNGRMPTHVKTEEDWNKWISENLAATKFSSIEEAKSMFRLSKELTAKNMDEFKYVWTQFKKASQSQLEEVVIPEELGY